MKNNLPEDKYHIHISSKHRLMDLKLKEVWRYRDLILLFTRRNFVVSYKQTILGPAWLFINPIISSLIYCFVFGNIAGIGTGTVPQLLFYMAGNAIWGFFSGCLTINASTFNGNAGVFGKVYFPRLVTPISNMLTMVIRFGIQMIMVLVFLVYYLIMGQVNPNWEALLLLPFMLLHLGMLGMGCGIVVSSLTTKYRDLGILVSFGMQLWMYITPVVYPLSQTGNGGLRTLMLLNPVTPTVEYFRYAFLGEGSVEPLFLAISWGITLLVVFWGIVIFNKVERTFMDTV